LRPISLPVVFFDESLVRHRTCAGAFSRQLVLDTVEDRRFASSEGSNRWFILENIGPLV
jgi:hypothetical protein